MPASNPNTSALNAMIKKADLNVIQVMANQLLKGVILQPDICVKTADTYDSTRKLLLSKDPDELVEYLSRPRTPGGYWKLVAAMKNTVAIGVLQGAECLTEHEGSVKIRQGQQGELKRITAIVDKMLVGLRNHTKPIFEKRVSKRPQNNTLNKDWYSIFCDRIEASNSSFKQHALLCLLCGVRPAELTAGTIETPLGVDVYFDNNQITVHIRGAKQKSENGKQLIGMPERRLVFNLPSDDPAIKLLLSMKPVSGNVLNIQRLEAKQIRGLDSFINKMGYGLLKHGRTALAVPNFSAYNLRHAFGSRLKQSGLTDEQVSTALGHMSMKTKQYYGHLRTKHTGGVAPSSVTSKWKPRPYTAGINSKVTAKASTRKAARRMR